MAAPAVAKHDQTISLPPDVKPWDVKAEKNGNGEPSLRVLTPNQAQFNEELMWQDH